MAKKKKKQQVYKGFDALGEAYGITRPEKKKEKHGQGKFQKVHTQKTKETQKIITNAGHYYYVKGKGDHRDFGKSIPDYTLSALIGLNVPLEQSVKESLFYIKRYFELPESTEGFQLTTTYPGLLIGVGYMHPIDKKNDNDFQQGFFFDWTTGVPAIPGSTIKGILRSVFPCKKKNKKDEEKEEIRKGKIAYLIGCMDKKLVDQIDSTHNFITSLETKIFEDKGDIFYDAYISGIPDNGKIFAEDYITHHPSPFSDPTPLRFLKIAPGVTFKFQFKLKDSKIDDNVTVTPKHKKELFEKILLDFGIGAKRNTGYGVLIQCPKSSRS